jgi:hypothetical protein
MSPWFYSGASVTDGRKDALLFRGSDALAPIQPPGNNPPATIFDIHQKIRNRHHKTTTQVKTSIDHVALIWNGSPYLWACTQVQWLTPRYPCFTEMFFLCSEKAKFVPIRVASRNCCRPGCHLYGRESTYEQHLQRGGRL